MRRQLVPNAIRVGEAPVAPVLLALLDQPVDVDIEHPEACVGVEREGRKEVSDERPGVLPASAVPILLTHQVEEHRERTRRVEVVVEGGVDRRARVA